MIRRVLATPVFEQQARRQAAEGHPVAAVAERKEVPGVLPMRSDERPEHGRGNRAGLLGGGLGVSDVRGRLATGGGDNGLVGLVGLDALGDGIDGCVGVDLLFACSPTITS